MGEQPTENLKFVIDQLVSMELHLQMLMAQHNIETLIDDSLIAGLDDYVIRRIPTGSFLMACLENNLRDAFGKADMTNRRMMPEIVAYLYNNIPAQCWGSPEKVQAWLSGESS